MLTKEIAQNIVNKMMNVVKYNINIMNKDGIIIGSGDKSRIGEIHYGAVEAIKKESEIENYFVDGHVKPGINTPIIFRESIVGVIGITGNPEEVRNFAKLVKVTAELLLSEQYSLKKYLMNERLKEEFLYEWVFLKEEYDIDFILRGKSLNIDITKERVVMVLSTEKHIEQSVLFQDEFMLNISKGRTVIILINNKGIKKRIKEILDNINLENTFLAIGRPSSIVNKSFMESLFAIEFGRKIFPNKKIISYDKVKLFSGFEDNKNNNEILKIIENIRSTQNGQDLMETIITLIEHNGERSKTAEVLHIHRNTLNYRLSKIEELTGLSFNNYIDLYHYIAIFILKKINENI